MIDTAHIIPGICASLRVAWISHGSADRLHVREAFQLRRKMPRLDAAGWLQLGSSASCLGAVARLRLPGQAATWGPDPYRSSTGLAFAWSRWGHVQIVIQEERCMAGTELRRCLVSRWEVTWHSVVCRVRERGKCETAAGQGMLRLSNQLDEVAATHFTSCRQASLFRQKPYYGKPSLKDLEPMHILRLAICRGAKLVTA